MNINNIWPLLKPPNIAPEQAADVPWRVGRKVGRTIYAQLGPEPSDEDPVIGMMDSPPLAKAAVLAHNIVRELETDAAHFDSYKLAPQAWALRFVASYVSARLAYLLPDEQEDPPGDLPAYVLDALRLNAERWHNRPWKFR